MNKLYNPFLLLGYAGHEYFCGRDTERKELISALRNGRNITLMSPRRMGKTGLIKDTFYQIGKENKNAVCLYMDIFATKSLGDFVALLGKTVVGKLDSLPQKTASAIANIFKSCRVVFSTDIASGLPQASLDFKEQDTQNTLGEIFSYIKESDKECIIAIDEFQQISEYPETETEALLRSYIQFCPNLHFIFSGSKQHLMDDIFSSAARPFYRSTEKMNLKPIPMETYFEFSCKWMKTIGITLDKDTFEKIYNMVEGHTWYVQYILNKLFELAPEKVTESDISECVMKIVEAETDDYKRIYDFLTINQAQLLVAIAKEHIVPAINSNTFIRKYNLKGTSSINKALAQLINKELVFHTENGYSVYDRFMEIWLKKI
ncbi:MAG: ATP-binding protein [Bacteroidales bacterium]|nr:ATP-binding protein [Bacteroidales bacterium]